MGGKRSERRAPEATRVRERVGARGGKRTERRAPEATRVRERVGRTMEVS
jgi:hypothetical protein